MTYVCPVCGNSVGLPLRPAHLPDLAPVCRGPHGRHRPTTMRPTQEANQ